MGAVRGWLLGLIGVSLVCALADALMPKGAVRRVGKLVCGLALILTVLTPLVKLNLDAGQRWLEGCLAEAEQREMELEQAVDNQMKIIIERDCAAYIVDKAAQWNVSCSAAVECERSEEGLYLPVRAEITGRFSEEERVWLAEAIAQDLGIPAQAQFYMEEEVP